MHMGNISENETRSFIKKCHFIVYFYMFFQEMKHTRIYSLLFTMYVTRTAHVMHVSSLSVTGSGVISSKYISGNDVVSTQARRRLKRNPMSSYLASKGAEVA